MRIGSGYAIGAVVSCLALGACDIPLDPSQTSERIRTKQVIRVGWVDNTPAGPVAQAALVKLSEESGARIEQRPGDSETLLGELEKGKLDLVYGRYPATSPWTKRVYFGRPHGWLAKPPKDDPVPRFAMPNGENRWIMAVEKASAP